MAQPLRLTILGAGPEVLPYAEAIAASPDLDVVAWCASDAIAPQLQERFPTGRSMERVELTGPQGTDAVLVGSAQTDPLQETTLRELARDGVPLALVQPACSAIFAVELDMIQRDTGAPMLPLHIPSLHPAVHWLGDLARAGAPPLGGIEQIVLERTATQHTRETVLTMLAQDGLLLRRMLGNFSQVGAMQAGDDQSLGNLSVHLRGALDGIGRWTVGPVIEEAGLQVHVLGPSGKVTLAIPETGPLRFESSVDIDPPTLELDTPGAVAKELRAGLLQSRPTLTWEDAFRCMDLADVASESVRRGKTLTVRNERVTEEDTFKGMMAAGGCLILMVLPLILLAVSLLDALHLPREKAVRLFTQAEVRALHLPGDVQTLETVTLADSGRPLEQLPSVDALHAQYPHGRAGRPEAFAVAGKQLVVGPTPDGRYEIAISYQGVLSFSGWWMWVLLVPMGFFLCLQCLKLVFPKPEVPDNPADPESVDR